MNIYKCYVLACNCYSGDNGVSVFWNEEDAYRAMIDELCVETINLDNSGYKYKIVQDDYHAELYVPDRDIYFDWYIEESTIR